MHGAQVRREQGVVEAVEVVAAVADQSCGKVREEARVERGGDKVRLIRGSAGHVHGDRETVTVDNRRDLGAFAAARWTDRSAPFFAEAKIASTKASLKSIFPRSRRSSARHSRRRSSRPLRCHC
jgi:hypothetical protein